MSIQPEGYEINRHAYGVLTQLTDEQQLRDVESHFLDHEIFGDTDRIVARTASFYELLVSRCAHRDTAMSEIETMLRDCGPDVRQRFTRDPAVRRLLHQHATLNNDRDVTGQPLVGGLMRAFQRAAAREVPSGGAVKLNVVGGVDEPWLWTESDENERDHYPLADVPRQIYADLDLWSDRKQPECVSGTAAHADRLREIVALLGVLLPDMSRVLTMHGACILLIEENKVAQSITAPAMPNVIVLAMPCLWNVWIGAESLLHEVLHCRLQDLNCLDPVVASNPDFDNERESINPPWHSWASPKHWTIFNALQACYVYSHLAVLGLATLFRGQEVAGLFEEPPQGYGPNLARKSFERACYLTNELRDRFGGGMTPLGNELVRWLREGLDKAAILI